MKHRIALYLLLIATLCMGCGGHGHMRQLEQLVKYKCTISQGTFDIQNSTGSFIVSIS